MMIAEFGTGEFQYKDLDKAAWYGMPFKDQNDYPRIAYLLV